MDLDEQTPDFLEYSRKLKLFSDNTEIKLPRDRKDRDILLLDNLKFVKEATAIFSEICKWIHFSQLDRVEYEPIRLTKELWRKATWLEKHANLIRSSPELFKDQQWQAELCEELSGLCENLGEYTQKLHERRSSIRSEVK